MNDNDGWDEFCNLVENSIQEILDYYKGENKNYAWNTEKLEFFDQNEYYRPLKPTEYHLLYLPQILKAKKLFGKTGQFLNAVNVHTALLFERNLGNSEDRKLATEISKILGEPQLREKDELEMIFNHKCWEK